MSRLSSRLSPRCWCSEGYKSHERCFSILCFVKRKQVTLKWRFTKTAPKANHPHFLPKKQTLKRFIIFKAQDFCLWSLFVWGEKRWCFSATAARPSQQKKLSGRVRTSSKPLVMRRRIPPSAAWRWKMCWVFGPVRIPPYGVDSGWGKLRKRLFLHKKKQGGKGSGIFTTAISEKHPGEI